MKLNGFDSDNYRYFYLDKSEICKDKYISFTYGELLENDIYKISREDLKRMIFSSTYYNEIIMIVKKLILIL